MASKAPNDHRDPYWAELSSATEEKLGLPTGLLTSIVTKGERSNDDQVSSAGAKTPFQIIPATRNAVLDKYGIDAYLSPENAAEAAGLLLQESLKRNDGDVASAVAEYHGGTDKSNWGPKTRAYVGRVINGQRQAQQPASQSTFQRVKQSMQPSESPDAISQVYEAYKGGRMNDQEKADFESDVKSGTVMLPKGATLTGQQAVGPTDKPTAIILPPEVTDAYQTGKMSDQERADLESDLKSGLVQLGAAGALPDIQNGQIAPDQPGIIQQAPDPTLAQQAIGAGETGLALGTGVTSGTVGMIGGTLKGLAEQLLSGQFGTQQAADAVEKSAMSGQEALTYAPRTEQGQQMTQTVGEAAAPLAALAPFAGEVGAIAQGARAAAPIARAAAGKVVAPIQQAAGKITEAIRPAAADVQTGAAGARSGGAAAVEAGALRQAKAQELPVPIKLTEGQKSRDFGQQRFERETAKDPELGAPIRERFEDQNLKIQQNIESFVDSTGAEAGDLRSVGQSVDKALRSRLARDKAKVRSLYKDFEKSGEADAPTDISPLADYMNQNRAARTDGGIMNKLGRQFDVLEVGSGSFKDGSLKLKPMTLGKSEDIRRFINKETNQADSTDIRIASELKSIIDEANKDVGGPIIKSARAARARMANDYERVGLVKSLVGKKGRSNDRAVALEDVLNRSIVGPSASLDDVRQVRRLLQTEGPSGQQAWKELQGATLNYIKDEALKNVARDSQGNPIVSPAQLDRAIQKLDKNGKLDFVFGKKGAEMLRTVNDVAKDVLVAPPGAVNTSNTASVLAGLMDVAISGTSGIPAPIMTSLRLATKSIKDRKTRARVRKALGVNKKEDE